MYILNIYLFVSGPFIGIGINIFGCRSCTVFGGVIAMLGLVGASFSKNLSSMMVTFGVVSGVYFCHLLCVMGQMASKRSYLYIFYFMFQLW